MDFSYSDEQRMLSDSLEKLFTAHNTAAGGGTAAQADKLWQACAETGLIGLTVPEDHGGLAGSSADVMVAAIQIGRHAVQAPFLSTAVAGAGALRLAGSDAQQAQYLPALAEGALKVACAFGEPDARYDLADVDTRAAAQGDGYVLNGAKSVVFGGDDAGLLIVSARAPDTERHDQSGLSLYLVDADADGVERTAYALTDGRGAADITFNDVKLPATALLGAQGGGYDIIEAVSDLAAAAICAEALGALEKVIGLTKEYLGTRRQFGKTLGEFQVLQHHLADMVLEYEHMKSLVYEAGALAGSDDTVARQQAVSAAKVVVAEEGRRICQQGMQMHGGIGLTEEFQLGQFVKRVAVADFAFGDADHHIARYGGHMARAAAAAFGETEGHHG
ncbi:acyl-CoA dehydrogenase family protein [Sulfitobacter sp. F26169L]|uniref:acyl-CoA dehydrogenase family protein n=1 Tax=Sulfitobacter sp. F26169L TaxID=2996015 RepID=UPI002260DFBD|nr:acyl-CoA dehydrogenase family protein [Sulfitobacter sp. F26169L]MCX7568113.1 acyl-CoA dehydrogenase family protein [Sulfitobacter sp. F26169L]